MTTIKKGYWNQIEKFTFTDGGDVDRTVWKSPKWTAQNNASFFGRTAIRNVTDFGTPLGCVPVINNAAQLYLDTYNPQSSPPNTSFLGAQISTIKKWGLASYNSVAFEAEIVLPMSGVNAAPGGAVAALFSYNLISQTPFLHDEIDFEIASNHWDGSDEAVNTNVYVTKNQSMNNFDKVVTTNLSLTNSAVIRIEWTKLGVSWYINKDENPIPFYTESHVPLTDMSLVLNFWVPASGWGWAYNSNLSPSSAPGTQYTCAVNWAKVWGVLSTVTTSVQANQGWQNTGLTVKEGDTISIDYVSGLWTADPNTNGGIKYNAAGCPGLKTEQSGYTMLQENMGGLCAFVGEQPKSDATDNIFFVGQEFRGPSEKNGQLWLCINDDLKALYGPGLKDNSGEVTMSITVS